MARAPEPMPDGHSRRFPTGVNRDFVFVPVTQQRGMAIRHSQFQRHGGDGEQRGQAFYPLLPMEMSRGRPADELITRQLSIFFCRYRRNPQLQGRRFGRKSRLQSPYLLDPVLLALDAAVDLGDFIPSPQIMHRRPADSQHPRNLVVGFVQVLADDFEPLTGQGKCPLVVRFGWHKTAVIYRIFCREFKLYSIADEVNSEIGFPSPPKDGVPKSCCSLTRIMVTNHAKIFERGQPFTPHGLVLA